jgi:hypothetical protein
VVAYEHLVLRILYEVAAEKCLNSRLASEYVSKIRDILL